MKNKTVTITVSDSFEKVFDFLAAPENMPLWAVGFCKSIRKEDNRWIITTPGGEIFFSVDTNKGGGCIDMYAGPTFETMNVFPIRVMKTDNGDTAVVFSFFKCENTGMTDKMYETQYRTLIEEAGMLVERFGGGEVSAEKPVPVKVYSGFVSGDLAATKAFYVDHFGFKPVFDAPFYLHLQRENGGEQLGFMAQTEDNANAQPEFEEATSGKGIWISVDVEDIDAEYERLLAAGLEFRQGPTDQPWGERTCVTQDPNGVLIYVAQKNGKMDKSLEQFMISDEKVLVS